MWGAPPPTPPAPPPPPTSLPAGGRFGRSSAAPKGRAVADALLCSPPPSDTSSISFLLGRYRSRLDALTSRFGEGCVRVANVRAWGGHPSVSH